MVNMKYLDKFNKNHQPNELYSNTVNILNPLNYSISIFPVFEKQKQNVIKSSSIIEKMLEFTITSQQQKKNPNKLEIEFDYLSRHI